MIRKHKGTIIVGIILLILLLDQMLKIWVKTSFFLYEDITIASWFHLHFIENNGMAFGMEIVSKTFLTLFRIVAVCVIGWLIVKMLRRNVNFGFVVCVSLIFAGALGNSIDCLFYGLVFDQSTPFQIATAFPDDGGYGTFLNGRVVDMFYFPFFRWTNPEWIPIWGGKECEFFGPVFNLADSAICVGVACILLFHRKTLQKL